MSQYSVRSSSTSSTTSQQNSSKTTSPVLDSIGNQARLDQLKQVQPEDVVSSALNWGGMMLTEYDDLSNNALGDIVPQKDLNGAMAGASAVMAGVQSYQDSPNQTIAGKSLDALLDASGSLMIGANPAVGAIDSFLPKEFQLASLYDGTSSAISSITEGLLTNDSTAMEGFMDKAKSGEYSIVVQEAVEAGEFWAKQLQ